MYLKLTLHEGHGTSLYVQNGGAAGWPWAFWVQWILQQKTKALSIGFNKFNRLLYSYMTIYTIYIIWLVLLIILHNDYFPNYHCWWLLFFINFLHDYVYGFHSLTVSLASYYICSFMHNTIIHYGLFLKSLVSCF